jgi:hypothetical protein
MGAYVSLHGHLVGVDSESGALRRPGLDSSFSSEESVTVPTTSANIKWRGVSTITTTGAADYTLNAPTTPTIGMAKRIIAALTSTSTAARTVTLASGTFQTTAGSSFLKLTFNGSGQAISLQALSTALVGVFANAGVTLST